MKIYELHDGIDSGPIAFFKSKAHAEISLRTIMRRYGVDDPEEVELSIFERNVMELPIED